MLRPQIFRCCCGKSINQLAKEVKEAGVWNIVEINWKDKWIRVEPKELERAE